MVQSEFRQKQLEYSTELHQSPWAVGMVSTESRRRPVGDHQSLRRRSRSSWTPDGYSHPFRFDFESKKSFPSASHRPN